MSIWSGWTKYRVLFAGTIAFWMTAGSAPALAADAIADSSGLQEIVVTARKKAEDIQSVPLSITALSGEDLNNTGVRDLRDLTFQTPGLTFTEGGGANYFSKPIIRGQTDIGGSGDNNVPVFFDGIYISNSSAIDLGLIDLDRVEVIKGPVSATYGRSAYAGAINYISAKPTDTLHGFAEASVGDYNKQNLRAGISGPIVPGIVKGNVSASYDRFDGTYHDDVTDQNSGGYKKRDILASLDITPTEHLEIRPVVYYGDDVFASSPTIFAPANCSVGLGFGYSQSYCGRVPDGTFQGPYTASSGQYGQTGNTRHVFLSDLQIAASYDWGTVSSLTGYNVIHSNEYSEFDDQDYGTASKTYYLPPGATVGTFPTSPALLGALPTGSTVLTPLHFGYTDKNRDFSEELRFTSSQMQAFRYTFGGYYAKSDLDQELNLARGTCAVPDGQYIISSFAVPCGQRTSGQNGVYTQENKIYAGFVGADWDLIDRLTLSTELRYTETKSEYDDLFAIFTPFPKEGYSTSSPSSANPLGPNSLNESFHSTTSRTSLSYKFTPDIMVYASAANGEKIGGFNNNIKYQTFQPETNWTYELGVKSTLFDRHLQLNADVFYIKAKDYQVFGPPPGSMLPGGFITTNYGGLDTRGFEFSATYVVTEGARLLAGVGYADPKFNHSAYDFGDVTLCGGVPSCAGRIVTVGPNKAVSLYGLHPPYESNLTVNVAVDLDYKVAGDWNWFGRVDYRYEDKQYYQYPIDTGYFGPKSVVNLRTGVRTGPFRVTLWARNLTNDKTPLTVQDAAVTGASNFQAGYFPIAILPDGRTYGVTLGYKF